MQNSQNKKTLQIVLLVLVALLTISIGYASITAINLIINGNATASVNQNNFIVHFIEAKNITGITGVGGISVIESDDTKASFNVTGLSKVGDYAEAKYVVKNDSNGIGTEITLELTNSNSEYFKVTETIDDDKLQAGEETYATVKVEMIKTPIDSDVSTSVTAKLVANPLENGVATGGDSNSIQQPTPFASDSWSTIKTNVQNGNTSQYNIGDTKIVKINNVNYTVRLANKSTNINCDNLNYSQTACGFVVEFEDIIDKMKMNEIVVNSNPQRGNSIGGYPATIVYNYINNDLYDMLPGELKNAIIYTKVVSGIGCIGYNSCGTECICDEYDNNGNSFITYDKLYLLSGVEIFGADEKDTAKDTTRQLDFYSGMIPFADYCGGCCPHYELVRKRFNGQYFDWWLRSVTFHRNDFFGNVRGGGMFSASASYYDYGVSPAFRIG